MSTFFTLNPATEEQMAEYSYLSPSVIDQKINKTHDAWLSWKVKPFSERAAKLIKVSELLKARKQEYGRLITTEMGKPLNQAISEVEKCAWVCEYYAENGEKFMATEVIESDASESFVTYQPLGLVLAIMPWNFPFWQVFRFAAPGLMAGNAALLKHAPNTTGCALAIEALFKEAGFDNHLFTTLIADIPQIEEIIANPKVSAVTLTGSTRAGKSVAALAGKYLKKTVLELGGSDPYLILDDADLDLAAEACVSGRLLNTGQSCIAAKRFIVTPSIEQAFIDRIYGMLSAKKHGDPLLNPDLGTIARADLRLQLHQQVEQSIEAGAQCLLGGTIPEGKGFFYPATLLTQVRKGMPAYDEELFGPVSVVITADDEEQAIAIANDSEYGLGSAVFSSDVDRARKMAIQKLEAGATFVNDFVKSDPRLPFGGIKQSGYGRELSLLGIREFTNAKTVYIR